MRPRILLLGDWHPLCRDGIDVLRWTFVGGTAAVAATGDVGGAANLAVPALAVWAARPLALPRPFDLSFVLAMALAGWGEALRLYDRIGPYDLVVHFLVPLLGAPVVYVALARLDTVPDPAAPGERRHLAGLFVVTAALGLALGAVWETLEWTSDALLGTDLALGERDTIGDLAADAAGSLVGAGSLVVWALYGWGTVRRAPAEAADRGHLGPYREVE